MSTYNGDSPPNNGHGRDVLNHVNNEISSLIHELKNIQQMEIETQLRQLQEKFGTYYGKRKLLHSSDTKVKFATQLAEDDKEIAFLVLRYYLGMRSEFQRPEYVRAAVLATNFDYQIVPRSNNERQAMIELRNEWQRKLTKQEDEISSLTETSLSLVEQQGELIEAHKKQFEKKLNSNEESLNSLLQSYTEQMEALKKRFNDDMATKSAVTYWSNKASDHKKYAKWFGGIAVFLAVVLIAVMAWGLYKAFSLETVAYWKMAIVAVMSSLAIWIIRVLVRIFISKLHLAEDAEERVAMVKTYLALLQEDNGLDGTNKEMVLSSLFRPGSIGLIKDEAPATPMDIALKVVEKAATK
ncbi:DUF6161 domain-containing protein [Kistimonas scapharcae]|uniref:DUF6161 domain-containing protein n=1 Tax=Kistimonas scapharcae TaxID=1036133 RepID=UPI0031E849B2